MDDEAEREEGRTAILVAHTHWDRAWYLPFQQFRLRLVRLIDRLLDILERDAEFTCFNLDGQMVVIEDYLEVRPERRGDLIRLARAGRLQVGPWYVLPDEFLVSPESLIRNLEIGMREAEAFGGAMPVGYEPDAFGHIGQLPQILAGFSIDNCVFWRGMGDEGKELGSEFHWTAPDGTAVLGIWLVAGYSAFEYLGYPRRGDEAHMPFRVEWALEKLQGGISRLAPYANTRCLLLMAGVDHEEANEHLPEIVREARRALPNLDLRIGSIGQFLECVKSSGVTLPEFRGELRAATLAYALQSVYSTRMHLKQRNNGSQTLLECYAEPLLAFASTLGTARQTAFLDLAWHELLKNHPHDDICGCSVDPVHREMEVRFDRVDQVGQTLARDALRSLTNLIALPDEEPLPIFLFNPNTRPFQGTVTTTLHLPPATGAFSLRDEQGGVIAHQETGRRAGVDMEVNRPRPTIFVDVAIAAPTIPACGYRTVRLGAPGSGPASPLRAGTRTLENDHLVVTINEDGTIDLLDRASGAWYRRLHALEDAEDAGDEYTYSPAPGGQTFTNADARVVIELLAQGPVRAGFRLRYRIDLPRSLSPDRVRRSDETVPYLITTDVWLGRDARQVEFETQLHNLALDHRLRVHFPTGLRTETVHAEGHFDVVPRPVALPEGRGWREPPSPTAHQRTFVDVSEGGRGMALLNEGLPEYEAIAGDRGVTIALTLLRSVGWLSRESMPTRPGPAGPRLETPEAQCLRDYRFRYAVAPHGGSWEEIIHHAHAFNAPPMVQTGRTTEGVLPSDFDSSPVPWEPPTRVPELDILPPTASFLTLEPRELVLSSVRKERDGDALLVRCYNPTDRTVEGRLQLLWPVRSAGLVNFLGEAQGDLPLEDGAPRFDARPHGIVTIRCVTAL